MTLTVFGSRTKQNTWHLYDKSRQRERQLRFKSYKNKQVGSTRFLILSVLIIKENWNILQEEYPKLGFDQLDDDIFESCFIARIVEPTSKLKNLRVLGDLGVDPINRNKLYRCLVKEASQSYRRY
jgi:hypothetical protein